MFLTEKLLTSSKATPEKVAFQFIDDSQSSLQLTYTELADKAKSVAAYLQSIDSKTQFAFLLYPTGLDFIIAFYACLFAGWKSIPLPVANELQLKSTYSNSDYIFSIKTEVGDAVILSGSSRCKILEEHLSNTNRHDALKIFDTKAINDNLKDHYNPIIENDDDVVCLLYTSGSTSSPKGVIIKHKNLIYNAKTAAEFWRYSPDSISVSWMPHYHSLGLIFNLIIPIYTGSTSIIMSPYDFAEKPARWLNAITTYKATHSAAPPFAYDLCVEQIPADQTRHMDLSSWEVCLVGGETTRKQTYDRFSDTFKPFGWKDTTFCPQYGLTETGHITTSSPMTIPNFVNIDKLRVEHSIACVGKPFPETNIIVVDSETRRRCKECEIGELWVSGPSVFDGYWNNNDANQAAFESLIDDMNTNRYFRTGDLGFMKDGEVYITGRLKEVMIFRGKNYYPQDIELMVTNSHQLLRDEKVAVFPIVVDGSEVAVIVQEIELHEHKAKNPSVMEDMVAEIFGAICEELSIDVYSIFLAPRGTIPKTPSGKIKRKACREMYEKGQLESVSYYSRRPMSRANEESPKTMSVVESRHIIQKETNQVNNILPEIKAIFSQILSIPPDAINPHTPFSHFNINSVQFLGISNRISSKFGISFPVTFLFKYNDLKSIVVYIEKQLGDKKGQINQRDSIS